LADGKPDILWREVPGGTVQIQFGPDRPAAFEVQPFDVAKYAITLQQFNAFAQSVSYFHEEWWDGLPIVRADRSPVQQWPHLANHPAEFISWYQAVAYCRWLSHTLGQTVRLPTEWEWQQ